MKRKKQFVGCFLLIVVIVIYWFFIEFGSGADISVNVVYHQDYDNIVELYYTDKHSDFSPEKSQQGFVTNKMCQLKLHGTSPIGLMLRLDPAAQKGEYGIEKIQILYAGTQVKSYTGKEFYNVITSFENCELRCEENMLIINATTNDPMLCWNPDIVQSTYWVKGVQLVFIAMVLLIIYLMCQNRKDSLGEESENRTLRYWMGIGIGILFVVMGVTILYLVHYVKIDFGDITIGELLYQLNTPLDGTNTATFGDAIGTIICLVILSVIVIWFVAFHMKRKHLQQGIVCWLVIIGITLISDGAVKAQRQFGVKEWWKYSHQKTTIYEENYVDGRSIALEFPQEKRNLIYIFMESMEVSYADLTAGGGIRGNNYIQELTEIANEGIDFSKDGKLNGAYTVEGTTFTMGALVAQTAGVPINTNIVSNKTLNSEWESENNYLPGVYSIGDILEQQGYHQMFMIGSDKAFSGRGSYFAGHGNYEVFDYYSAIEEQKIAEDYHVWWGYEDRKLIKYAKEKILELSEAEEPFNFTMLTADTHFTDGCYCKKCSDDYDMQYSNVIACSSKQISSFVKWIKKQDFFENTTIVLAGDHLTMDTAYVDAEIIPGYDRRTFVTIINPADGCEVTGRQREYTTMDMFPTTLAALGVSIPGDRLGLGTNLFSDQMTLAEEIGFENLNEELMKDSDLYRKKLLYGK